MEIMGHECRMVDDETPDAVVSVDGKWIWFASDYASTLATSDLYSEAIDVYENMEMEVARG